MKNVHGKGHAFWEKEYKKGDHLALSTEPSEDLIKFTRWLERESGNEFLNSAATVADLGCGNGRNLIYLAQTYGMKGVGFDISHAAVNQAKKLSEGLPLEYKVASIANPLPLPDHSQTLVLDMMTSHFLNSKERHHLLEEILRILKPTGYLFWKTFLLDEDRNAKRLLRDNPAEEKGSYIHPEIGVAEHVFTEEEIVQTLEKNFIIHKITKSHRHLDHGRAFKRRSISIFAQKMG